MTAEQALPGNTKVEVMVLDAVKAKAKKLESAIPKNTIGRSPFVAAIARDKENNVIKAIPLADLNAYEFLEASKEEKDAIMERARKELGIVTDAKKDAD